MSYLYLVVFISQSKLSYYFTWTKLLETQSKVFN